MSDALVRRLLERRGDALSKAVARRAFSVVVALCLATGSAVAGAGVVGSRHDLSTGTTPEVCEFCHTPHNASQNLASPLWNRAETTQVFTLYGSPSLDATPGQPGTATSNPGAITRLCLSCHDGVNAYTDVHGRSVSTKHDVVMPPRFDAPDTTTYPNCERCHPDYYSGRKRVLVLGTDLSDDHPVSMPYPAGQGSDFVDPPDPAAGWGGSSRNDVKLFAGFVECSSCHEVHDNGPGHFLRKSNAGSALCLTCHMK